VKTARFEPDLKKMALSMQNLYILVVNLLILGVF